MQESDREYGVVDYDVESPRYLAEYLLLAQLIVMLLEYIEVALGRCPCSVLSGDPILEVVLIVEVGDILDIIEAPSFGDRDDTVLMKDLPENDIFLS